MSAPANGNGWKNVILAILSTAVITSTTQWFAFGRDAVRRSELVELQATVRELNVTVGDLKTAVAVLSANVANQNLGGPAGYFGRTRKDP